ncbi:alpha/beta fold hydrolase [Aestuariirhabdus litorea]|uniref:Alpha/beta hydrolase n=1 Tax=Aestuariirhabdus litorea TaxID=2528527 RepID=A0A3P3VQ80_9GAMM|nr:alpha/beta hydrolase [Aestuariirhabdus litorea]RRJ84941.1 alpha/beta hydrolase [Aestuariirhabdus litorea]RWW98166.1 alpha/beta fold hydrolase [Endozoicomonadaceae bacterium GTF-13]
MKARQIHFAHANGFPSGSYRKLFLGLESHGYEVGYLEQHGHNPRFPVTHSWGHLVDELIEDLEQRYSGPVVGVGHSLGGVLCSFAAARRPDLFSAVVMLDSFIIGGAEKLVISLAKSTGWIDRITPAGRTRNRKAQWRNHDEARRYFRNKGLFAHFDSDCLEDYLRAGLRHRGQQVELVYHPDVEVNIYRNVPHRSPPKYNRFEIPTALLYGDRSDVVKASRIRRGERLPNLVQKRVTGTHMFPLEHPLETAHHIHSMIEQLLAKES